MLHEAARLVDGGKLTPCVDPRRFDFSSAESAYQALSDGTARGKLVVDIA